MRVRLALIISIVVGASPVAAQPRKGSGAPPPPATGTVSGSVKVTDTDGKVVSTSVVVYIVGPTPPADKPQTAKIIQLNKAFDPDLIAVTVGDSVTFPNKDSNLHNVFSPNPKFDLGSLKNGEGGSRTFSKPGVVDVYCNIHPQMAATILVLPNRHHTVTKTGTYTLSNIPVGEWTIYAYTRRVTKPMMKKIKVVAGEKVATDLAVVRGPEPKHQNLHGEEYTPGAYEKKK